MTRGADQGSEPSEPHRCAFTDDTGDEWRDAKELLRSQPALRSELGNVFASFPPTGGLYADEDGGSEDDDERQRRRFADFAERVRSFLAASPSTVVRRAADASLELLCRSDAGRMGELYELVGLEIPRADEREDVNAAPVDLPALAAAVGRVRPGSLHARWSAASAAASRPAPWEAGDGGGMDEFRARIAGGMRAKAAKASASTGEGDGTALPPSDGEVESAVRRAVEREGARLRRAREEAARMEVALASDGEYRRYVRARELWAVTGAEELWEAYRAADWANLKGRRNRGGALEGDGAALVFRAIALVLAREKGRPASSYWYLRGARWREVGKRRGRCIGEIDLVVLQEDGEVAALCEMKAGCFEIASAFAQHEKKLSAALGASTNDSLGGSLNVEIVAPDGECLQLPDHGEEGAQADIVPIFVVTVPPSGNVLGAEPALSQAVCDGIRAQGRNVWDRSTEEAAAKAALPEPLKAGLCQLPREIKQDATNQTLLQRGIDLAELEKFVQARIGRERESPAGCLSRLGKRILVLPRSAIRWQLYSDP